MHPAARRLFSSSLFIYVLYPIISFGIHFAAAVVFNRAYWQAFCWRAADKAFGNPTVTKAFATVGDWLGTATHFMVVGIFVTFMAEVVYKDTPSFKAEKRPKYGLREKLLGYGKFYRDTAIAEAASFILTDAGKMPIYGLDKQSPFTQSINPFASVTSASAFLRTYCWFGIMVQVTLLLSDFLYTALHITQHKFRSFYKFSGHDYHHNFHYPLAMCGPWLSPVDLIVSAQVTFFTPVDLVRNSLYFWTRAHHLSPSFTASFVIDQMLLGYINAMNDYDHCGKQIPCWSGFPLCPMLGFKLGLQKSIPNHEAHHNFSNCGFGLLSVADRCFGTYGEPTGIEGRDETLNQ